MASISLLRVIPEIDGGKQAIEMLIN